MKRTTTIDDGEETDGIRTNALRIAIAPFAWHTMLNMCSAQWNGGWRYREFVASIKNQTNVRHWRRCGWWRKLVTEIWKKWRCSIPSGGNKMVRRWKHQKQPTGEIVHRISYRECRSGVEDIYYRARTWFEYHEAGQRWTSRAYRQCIRKKSSIIRGQYLQSRLAAFCIEQIMVTGTMFIVHGRRWIGFQKSRPFFHTLLSRK